MADNKEENAKHYAIGLYIEEDKEGGIPLALSMEGLRCIVNRQPEKCVLSKYTESLAVEAGVNLHSHVIDETINGIITAIDRIVDNLVREVDPNESRNVIGG